MTWTELHALDASYWFTEECSACKDQPQDAYIYRGIRTGEKQPPSGYKAEDFAPTRLEDVIERFPDFVLNIEIKGSYPDSVPVAEELAKVLEKQRSSTHRSSLPSTTSLQRHFTSFSPKSRSPRDSKR